jgi:diguanylate cyclase (GGDEF)-like protein
MGEKSTVSRPGALAVPRLGVGGWYLATAAVTGIVVLVGATVATRLAQDQARESWRMAEQANEIAIESDRVVDLLRDAETAKRAYLLTGTVSVLPSFDSARAGVQESLTRLKQLTAGDERNAGLIAELAVLTDTALTEGSAAVEFRRRGDLVAAEAALASQEHNLDPIRAIDAVLAADVERQVAQQEASARGATTWARTVSGAAAVLVAALLVAMLGLLRQRGRLEQRRAEDATERLDLIDQLSHLASHDALTGLPNRRLLADRVQQALVRNARDSTLTALFFVDLDRFKHINDSRGHAVGDAVLAETARRLRSALRTTDTLARVGGDEFVIVCEGLTSADEADRLAQSLEDRLAGGVEVDGHRVPVTASLGVVVAEHDRIHGDAEPRTLDADVLVAAADAAMYDAKESGRACRRYYNRTDATRRTDRSALIDDLGNALAQNQLWVAYQPLVDLAGGRAVGVEALLRWGHPVHGPVPPAVFIPVAEESGLILPVGTFVLREACAQVARWNTARAGRGLPPLGLSVNCSARQLMDPDFLHVLTSAMRDSGLAPAQLTLELTEGVLIDSVSGAVDRLEEVVAAGVSLSLDDFGTGYSSLSYLRRFPVGQIKIDRSFISGLGNSDADEAIISAVVSLADRLGRRVLAEGIETPEQARHVIRLGCTLGQGYLYGRPVEPAELAGLLTGGAAASPARATPTLRDRTPADEDAPNPSWFPVS